MNNITEKSIEIKTQCERGSKEDIENVLLNLNNEVDLPTTKIIDYYLGTVKTNEGIACIEYFLFNGTQIQRNYCTLYFARKNEWNIVNKAYSLGLIDYVQAYSR